MNAEHQHREPPEPFAYCHICDEITPTKLLKLRSGQIANVCRVCRTCRKGRPFVSPRYFTDLEARKGQEVRHARSPLS